MGWCKHHNIMDFVWRLGGHDESTWFGCASFEAADARICQDCGAWLSLGPANNGPPFAEQVAVEIEAAGIAGGFCAGPMGMHVGREMHQLGIYSLAPVGFWQSVGWLAAEIEAQKHAKPTHGGADE